MTVIVASFPTDRLLIISHMALSGDQAVVSTSAATGSPPSGKPMVTCHLLAAEFWSSHHIVGAMMSGGNTDPSNG